MGGIEPVGVRGLEPRTSWSQTMRATNCATPRQIINNYLALMYAHYSTLEAKCQALMVFPAAVTQLE